MNWTLEVIALPVEDVDRAKDFYSSQVGFVVDHDVRDPQGNGVVQLTPPGSGCSIVLGRGIVDTAPGSVAGIQLVVADLRAARAQLAANGVDVSEIVVIGPEGPRTARDDDDLDNVGFVQFRDPDGNRWAVQQISARERT